MIIDLSFKSNYSIEVLEELASGERFYYPSGTTSGGMDGLIIKITPILGDQWVGVFGFGEIASNGISGIYTMPDPDKVCVVSKGAGYIVSSTNPKEWEEVKSIPITDIRCIRGEQIIVFADYTELVAYNDYGIKWTTERLAYDSFKIIEIKDGLLRGQFWNIRNEANETFEVNLQNGSQAGGIKEI